MKINNPNFLKDTTSKHLILTCIAKFALKYLKFTMHFLGSQAANILLVSFSILLHTQDRILRESYLVYLCLFLDYKFEAVAFEIFAVPLLFLNLQDV